MRAKHLTFILFFALQSLLAQQPAATPSKPIKESSIEFTSHSNLVMIPVIVRRSGQHVGGLKKEDFTIKEAGHIQQVASFEEINTVAGKNALKAAAKAGQTEFSNIGPGVPTRFTLVVLDVTTTHWESSVYARMGVLKFLRDSVSSDQPLALIKVGRGGHIQVIHDFSSDPRILASSLDAALKTAQMTTGSSDIRPPADSTGTHLVDDIFIGASTFDAFDVQNAVCGNVTALRAMARAFAGVTGRKSVIWVGDESPILPPLDSPAPTLSGGSPIGGNRCALDGNEALLELNTANMALYPVDPRGLCVNSGFASKCGNGSTLTLLDQGHGPGGTDPNANLAALRNLDRNMKATADPVVTSHGYMKWAADATGGKAYYNSNDLAGLVAKAADDSADYYQLSYYLDKNEKPGWHKLKVEVDQHGVEVRTRSGFLTQVQKKTQDTNDVRRALGSPFMQAEIPLLVRWAGIGGGSDSKRVDYELSVPATGLRIDDTDTNHVSISVHAFAVGQRTPIEIVNKELDGHLSQPNLEKFSKSGLNFNGAFEVPPGVYEVRFAVRDNISGKVGTVIASLDAR